MNKIRIVLADDHSVVRAGVRAFLKDEPDMLLVGEASNTGQAVALAQQLQPHVAILDISMPGYGLEATRQIRSTCPGTQVLILTFHDQEYYLLRALQAGAAGYVLKSAMDTELLNAIRIVVEGGVFLRPSATKLLVEDYQARLGKVSAEVENSLNERERELVRLIALGLTTSEAAEALMVSPKSVETYRTHIMQKLGIHSRIELVRYALVHDLLKEDLDLQTNIYKET